MRLAEIFLGFDGEVSIFGQGSPSIFIRFAGCPLRCTYCDTMQFQSLHSGESVTVEEVFHQVKMIEELRFSEAKVKKVTITGGEPLLQYYDFWKLVKLLNDDDWDTSVETNGSMPLITQSSGKLADVDSWIVDYKLPSSGMEEFMMPFESYGLLGVNDFIKFVIQDEKDLKTAFGIQIGIQDNSNCKARFAYSPVWGKYDVKDLAKGLLFAGSEILGNCIINYQLHKLWGDLEKKKVKLM